MPAIPELIVVPRTDAIYNCHSYLTKVPIGAIQPFIEAFTAPGELVADLFAGSGMTGLAALKSNRRAHVSDIAELGKHIATGLLINVPGDCVRDAAETVVRMAKKRVGSLYDTRRSSDAAHREMIRTIWSFTYKCPNCGEQLAYYEAFLAVGGVPRACEACGEAFSRRSWPRGKDIPMAVVVEGEGGKQVTQTVSDVDRRRIREAGRDQRLDHLPSLSIDEDREMFSRSGLGRSGLTETGKFFSSRNAIALLELWQAIENLSDSKLRKKLKLAFTAILPRASKRYQWSPQRPLNAQNQTYYIAPVYFEWNVFELFKRKVEAVIRANSSLHGEGDLFAESDSMSVTYEIASADELLHLDAESVDYIFTDPPFGSNIFYSDMNLFQEAWLGDVTDRRKEAVVFTTGKKKNHSAERYEDLLRSAFSEACRVLKPGRHMSVVFGNSKGSMWGLVQRAIRDAGFMPSPTHVAILDKGQRSVKGLASGTEGVVTVDLILTVQKPTAEESIEDAKHWENGDASQLIEAAIQKLDTKRARNPSHVYAGVLREAIQRNMSLDNLHLSDVLLALRSAGFSINAKTGCFESKAV